MFLYPFIGCVLFGLVMGTNAQDGYYLLGVVTWTAMAYGVLLPILIVLWLVGWLVSTKQAADTVHSGVQRVKVVD